MCYKYGYSVDTCMALIIGCVEYVLYKSVLQECFYHCSLPIMAPWYKPSKVFYTAKILLFGLFFGWHSQNSFLNGLGRYFYWLQVVAVLQTEIPVDYVSSV